MRIGIYATWHGSEEGFLALSLYDALREYDHEVSVFPVGHRVGQGWRRPEVVTDSSTVAEWIEAQRPDAVISVGFPDLDVGGSVTRFLATNWRDFRVSDVEFVNAAFDAVLAFTRIGLERLNDAGVERVHRVDVGVDLERFRPRDGEDSRARFLHRFGDGSGARSAREAFERSGSVGALHVVYPAESERTVRDLGDGIEVTEGTSDRDDLARLYGAADVALFPSRFERVGLSFARALASGLPIVTLDAAPMDEFVIDGQSGLFCDHDFRGSAPSSREAIVNVTQLASLVRFLDDHPGFVGELGRRARVEAERRFDRSRKARDFVALVEGIVG